MKNYIDKVAILDVEKLEEMISEMSYLRILIDKDVKPMSVALKKIHIDLEKTLDNFDVALACKTAEVIEKIDVDYIHREVIRQVIKRFDGEIKDMEDLSKLTQKIAFFTEKFHDYYEDIEKILNAYDQRINQSKRVQKAVNFAVVASAFTIGWLYLPVWYLIFEHIL